MTPGDLQTLAEATERLSDSQMKLVLRMVRAMQEPVEGYVARESDILQEDVATAFANQLVLHHATHDERLNKKSFEYLFKYANEAAGRTATINQNTTLAGADIVVNGERFSLKTQSDGGIKPHAVYVQKFMEARWMRDCETREALARELSARVGHHLTQYDRVLMLRGHKPAGGSVRYELLEIPKDVLGLMVSLTPEMLSEKNTFGSAGADLHDSKGIAFRVLLDGSVEKVRIFNLRIDRCILHGWWQVPLPREYSASDATASEG